MKKLTIILLVALLVPATFVWAQMRWHDKDSDEDVVFFEGKGHGFDGPGMGQGMRGHGWGGQGCLAMAEELGLTDDQQDKIRKMATENQLAMVDKRAAAKKAQIGLRALMHDDADEAKVLAAMDEVARLQADIKKSQYLHHQQVKGLLTAEQVEKMKSLHSPMGNRMFEGKMGGRGKKMHRTFQFDSDG